MLLADRGYDADYPDGQTIFDRSGSVTLTLTRDGEHRLDFSQIGMVYPNTQSSGLAGPSLGRGTPRDFLPYFMTVRKLN